MTDITLFNQCTAEYMPEAYADYDSRCGKVAGHVSEHVTKFKLPDVLNDGEIRKIFWDDVITTKLDLETDKIYSTCTCGWRSDPTSKLEDIATEAFDHAKDMEHLLRKHVADD